jgi:hypothetical protein
VQPSEFRRMVPQEFWLIYDARIGGETMYGRMTESDVEEFYSELK